MMRILLAVLMMGMMALRALAAEDTLVFVSEQTDSLGLPVNVVESIGADGVGRTVLSDPRREESTEKSSLIKRLESPNVSALGKKIVLRRGWTVSVMNWDGDGKVDITPYSREWYTPKWSPDGKQIALCSDISDNAEIFIMDYNGNNLHNITWQRLSAERAPCWSPDGKKICFISNRGGKFELFTMNADGMEQKKIVSLAGDIREPVWGAGDKIAFSLQLSSGNSALYVADADGGNPVALTDGAYWDGQVAWDQEGKRLAFVSNRSGNSDLWIIQLQSREMRNVTNTPDCRESFPSWVPRLTAGKPLEVKEAVVTGMELPRPRLLFRSADIPAIRARLTADPVAPIWKAFLAHCDRYCDPASTEAQVVEKAIREIQSRPSQGLYDRSGWITPIFNLAFAWQITGERKYGERGASWFVRTAGQYALWHQTIVFEYPTACSYDWLYSVFTDAEREQVRRILLTTAKGFYQRIVDLYFSRPQTMENNFATHDAGSFGPALLALSGEPGGDSAWLAAAARLAAINLNTWIGKNGDCSEGTSYFNRPVYLLLPFLVSMKVNGIYPEAYHSRLEKFSNWMAVVSADGILPSIGDSDGGPLTFPEGLLQLYPDNKLATQLWNSQKRAAHPEAEVLSLLWFPAAQQREKLETELPLAEYFDGQNYQVFRTGYNPGSRLLTFSLTAGGHAHLECGAVSLSGLGDRLLVDAGQSVWAADCHSQLLIDGQGRYVNYSAEKNRQRIGAQVQEGDFIASTVHMKRAFANSIFSHASADYSIPAPGLKIGRGSRTVCMVGRDGGRVPPYYVLYDDVLVDSRNHKYEQLYITAADSTVDDGQDGSFIVKKAYTGGWLAPKAGGKGAAQFEFTVKQGGKYQVWVYMKRPEDRSATGIFSFHLGAVAVKNPLRFKSASECWQWGAAEDAFELPAGKHTMQILPCNTLFAKIALVPEAASKHFSGWGVPPQDSIILTHEEAALTDDGWTLQHNARPSPELLVCSLNADPVQIMKDSFSFYTRFYGKQFITLPRTRLVRTQAAANFLTVVYPYAGGMECPTITKTKTGGVLRWKNVTDTVIAQEGRLEIMRKDEHGAEQIFNYQIPSEAEVE